MWLSLLCLLSSQCFSQINCCMDMEAKRKLVLRDAAVGRGEGSHGRGRSRDFWSWRDSCPAERGKGKNASMKCQRRTIPDSNLCSEIIRPSALFSSGSSPTLWTVRTFIGTAWKLDHYSGSITEKLLSQFKWFTVHVLRPQTSHTLSPAWPDGAACGSANLGSTTRSQINGSLLWSREF